MTKMHVGCDNVAGFAGSCNVVVASIPASTIQSRLVGLPFFDGTALLCIG